MLGPLAVDPSCRELGVGAALMNHALAAAKARGHGAVILLGDAPYYARFGFSADKTGELSLPGPFERDRLLGLELAEGALDGAWGMIVPTGASVRKAGTARIRKALRPVPQRGLIVRIMPQTLPTKRPVRVLAPPRHHHHAPADRARRHDRQGHPGAPLGRCPAAAPDVTHGPP